MYQLVDTHAHIGELKFLDQTIEEARRVGLKAVVAMGMDYKSNHLVLNLAQKHKGVVYPALGLHPSEVARERPRLQASLEFIENNIHLAVAVGEIGLDYDKRVRKHTDKDVQQGVFRELLQLAKRHDMPVSVHSRYAWKDSLALIRDAGVTRAVFHWFTGFSSTLKELLDEGYYISATPAAEYHEEHRRAVRETPLSRILLETDCPVTYGMEVKYTSSLRHIIKPLEAVADIKSMDKRVVAEATTRNAFDFFGLTD